MAIKKYQPINGTEGMIFSVTDNILRKQRIKEMNKQVSEGIY